jgi:hypothetical protein
MDNEIDFTVTELAEAAGVSKTTVKRAIEKGKFPGARKVGEAELGPYARWVIPFNDVLDLGWPLPNYPGNHGSQESTEISYQFGHNQPVPGQELITLQMELEHTQELLEIERAAAAELKAAHAETLEAVVAAAAELKAAHAETISAYERILGPAPAPQGMPFVMAAAAPPEPVPAAPAPTAVAPAEVEQPVKKKRFWQK